MNTEKCHCGKPLHYNSPDIEKFMKTLVDVMGRYINVTCNGKTYRIDRHYIALHGVKGFEVETLGFEEIM